MQDSGRSKNKTVLVVDDDTELATAIVGSLRRRGYKAESAVSTQEGIRLALAINPDLAVIDLNMGDGPNGLACTGALKMLRPNADIVVLTGYASIPTAIEAVKLGARQYVCKPASVPDILTALGEIAERTLRRRKMETDISLMKAEEMKRIQTVLALTGNNISETARRLSMHRRTLQRKIEKYG